LHHGGLTTGDPEEVVMPAAPGAPAARLVAAWLERLAFADIPETVLADAKLRVLDTIGVSLAASASSVGDVARRTALRLGRGDESTILGFGDRVPASSAALVNGTLAHALDFDDTHNESVIHVSAPIVTTATAIGEMRRCGGRELLVAAVGGAEIACRIGCVRPGAFHRRGFHATGVIGTFGAALTAGKLLGLDGARMTHALGIAGSQAAGILEFFSDGSWAKRLHPGWAAHAGIIAAYLAADGFSGPATVLEGRFGLFATHLGPDGYAMDRVVDGLGQDWECVKSSFKPYPCGHVVHPFVDAILALHRDDGLRWQDVERIDCPTAAWMIPIMCEPRAVKLRPESDYHAKFSFPYALAAALYFGRLGVEAFTAAEIHNPELLGLVQRVHNEVDPSAPDPSRFKGWVIVTTKSGRRLEKIVEDNWGSERNPLRPDDVRAKFRDNAALVMAPERIDQVVERVDALDRIDDVATLLALCVGSPAVSARRV
jgi:2-methylcitrate dehydratase PrpD